MSDKNKRSSAARQAGRGVGWLIEKLLGREGAGKLTESADVLRREYEAGKREGEEQPPRAVPYREVKADEPTPEAEDAGPNAEQPDGR